MKSYSYTFILLNLTDKAKNTTGLFRLDLTAESKADFSIVLANQAGNEVIAGYDKSENQFYIDRTKSGNTGLEKGFAERHVALRFSMASNIPITLIADVASVELFADNGLTVMTDIFFPENPISQLSTKSVSGITVNSLKYDMLKLSVK